MGALAMQSLSKAQLWQRIRRLPRVLPQAAGTA